jgi:glycosyltransferase involved in cell wall biosynthesis
LHFGLNLLFIVPGQNGGTQVYSESLIQALADLNTQDTFTVFVSREGAALNLPMQPNFRKVVCPINSANRELRYLWEQTMFPWYLRAHRVDLLHSLGYVGPLLPPCPQVVTIHDVNFIAISGAMASKKQAVLSKIVPLVARRSARVLAVSQFSKEQIVQHLSVPADRVCVTLEGPRAHFAEAVASGAEIAAAYGVKPPYIMAFGSLSEHKNIDRLVQAVAEIQSRTPHSLVLAGHLPPGTDLRSKIEALGLGDRIKITGYVPDSHIMPLLENADLFVFPSLYEGFGLPVLEAQAAGVAVACSTAASLPEVAGDGAAFFDPHSTEDMARVLLECLGDPRRRQALTEAGRANVGRFSWKQTAEATLACYRQVLGA